MCWGMNQKMVQGQKMAYGRKASRARPKTRARKRPFRLPDPSLVSIS
ncbi:hypothetical protein ID866_10865 [Astraeus odoratus]|nr:hypothetical protein ID866_10865 [Astraeus odoratus]